MIGSVFFLEWNSASRRSRHHHFRAVYTLVVVVEFLFFVWGWFTRGFDPWAGRMTPWQVTAQVAGDYLPLFMLQHLLLVLLVTPALAAGSVTDEKTRGTLALLLTTELTPSAIVAGKWLGQTIQVLVLVLPALPFIVFLQAMCGIPPAVVGAWAAESVLLAMTLAAVSLLASVFSRKTTTAVASVYALFTAALVGFWLAGYGSVFDQLTLIHPAYAGIDAAWPGLMLVAAALTATSLAWSAWRLRATCSTEAAPRSRVRRWWWLDRPPVRASPIRWKERYVGELGLLAFARVLPQSAGIAIALALGFATALLIPGDDEIFLVHGLGIMVVVGLLVAVRSSGAICRERERQTWEGLLLTPLEPYDLVRGKLWGIVDSIKPYLLAYLLGTMVWAARTNGWAVINTAVCWLATWAVLYFQAANGLYWSARLGNSWHAMLYALITGTVAIGLGQASILVMIVAVVVTAVLTFCTGMPAGGALYSVLLLGILAPVSAQLFAQAERLLQQAQQQIAVRDRIAQGRGRRGPAIPPIASQTILAGR